ncbi:MULTISPECIES: hypothetical protein [unclassified Corynebacterium]|uniref:hypothetical protein n=1 Tax=unclassified Corynebacterium TaxID=2624378 RepID=UPI0029C9C8FE|nr:MULTISPECIES: hypothetical protein [unclassified Corynebacterium]WPF65705.1 hypothetical protein OLX12_09055 [Corynebacterium sp. 22KM0430]WPF68201.1 hypothetical protein OLW90_09050 [Corynebacterium sp. 21KM1197]
MSSLLAPPASVSSRRRYLLGAYASLGIAAAAIPLLFVSLTPSMILWTLGLGGYVGWGFSLVKATGGQSQSRLDNLDEYQLERVLLARSRAMTILLCGLLTVMIVLLVLPAFITTLQPSPEETATWVRATGMSVGIIALGSSVAVLRDIATGMNRDETLSPGSD